MIMIFAHCLGTKKKQNAVSESRTNVVNAINTTAERSYDKLNSDLTSECN